MKVTVTLADGRQIKTGRIYPAEYPLVSLVQDFTNGRGHVDHCLPTGGGDGWFRVRDVASITIER